MSTARLAREYNREVFAVPGGPHNPAQAGCNLLIKTHVAQLLDGVEDLIGPLGWEANKEKAFQQKIHFKSDNPEHQKILEQLQNGTELLDVIALNTGLPVSTVATLLFELEMMGAVRPMAGKRFGLA